MRILISFILISLLFLSGCINQETSLAEWSEAQAEREENIVSSVISEKDFSGCSDYPSRSSCIKNAAEEIKDINVCTSQSNLNNESEIEYCYVGVAKGLVDASVCDNIKDPFRKIAVCYYGVGRKLNDSSICQRLQDSQERAACIDFLN